MKKLIILLTAASFVLMTAPLLADDGKKRRISGVKSSENYDRSSRRDQRPARRNEQRTERRREHRRERHTDQRRNHRRNHQSNRPVARHRNYHRNGRHYGSSHRYRYGHNSYRYQPRYRYHHNRHHRHYSSDRYGYLLGGVILGSAIANASHRHDAHCGHHYDHSSRVITTRVIREGTYGRSDDVHLFRDRYGNCFEVSENRNGDEVRTEIDAYHCEW